MSREIKFRAWNEGYKTMSGSFGLTDISAEGAVVGGNDSYTGDITGEDGEVVIMQYTGLTDRNGKEIYEGDIIRMFEDDLDDIFKPKLEIIGPVAWNGEWGAWFAEWEIGLKTGQVLGQLSRPIEIIGNIYENKELLNV